MLLLTCLSAYSCIINHCRHVETMAITRCINHRLFLDFWSQNSLQKGFYSLAVNVFGLWKPTSNHTFYSQSWFMVQKFPNFLQNFSAWGQQNPWRKAWTEQGHRPGHPSCHPPTGVTWSRRVIWYQPPLVAIPWWRQRDSAENSGTFSTINTINWLCE